MPNPLKRIFHLGRKNAAKSDSPSPLAGIDEETLDIARQIAFEKKLKRDVNAKWNRGKKSVSDDEILDALRSMKKSSSEIVKRVFERTVKDTVLANKFVDASGAKVQHLTVRKAAAMDGLRDIDDDVAVSMGAASAMNPEGRFNIPLNSSSTHEFAERFNEAMDPVRNGRFRSIIPEEIMDHFGNFATFIGYPMAEMIACHPTVSNACTIPGEDAIAPGYTLSFLDSEDLDGNGIPDDLEIAEMGGVKRSLGRIGAMEGLKDAIVALSGHSEAEGEGRGTGRGREWNSPLDALALALERLSAYEEWERTAGAGENAALAVNEGFVAPVNKAFTGYLAAKGDDASRNEALSALSLALADLSKKEHPVLDEVRTTQKRRETVAAVTAAVVTFSKPEDEWDSVRSLNDLAVAVERVAAYEAYSDRNAEALAALNMALIDFSERQTNETRTAASEVLKKTVAAMDAADFDFVDPAMQAQVQAQAEAQAQAERQHAAVLEQERLEDRKAKAELAAHTAEAKEGRINDLHQQKMGFLAQQQAAKQKVAEQLAGLKGKSVEAQEARADEAHQQKMAIAKKMAEQKLQQQQQAFEAQQQQAMAQQAQVQEQAKADAEAKKKQDEKQEKTKIAAEVAKERQKYLDRWKQRADSMGLNDICMKLARNARVFGIGIAVPIVDGVDYEEPMDFAKVREGSYRGFTVIEPTWIYPEVDSDDLVNPMSPSFFEPKYWAATGSSSIGSLAIRRIHRSWMVIVRNKEVPNMLRPMYYYGGIPLTQEIYEAVYCADKVMNEVPKLAMTKRTTVVKGDPNDLITNPEGVVERLQAYSQVQDNFGMLFVGRNADVQKLETSLSEFDQLIAKCNQRIASIAKMPETKLFKTQLAGMNSAGRYEWDDYSQLLINIQNNWFVPLLTLHYRLDTKSRTGKVIELKVNFNPIDVPTQAEKGEAESRVVQTINQAVQGGWLTAGEGRMIARSREDSMFSSISAEMPEELLQQQQQQQGGMPGMPGAGGGDPMGGGMPGMPPMGGGGGNGEPQAPEPPQEPDAPKEADEAKEASGPKPPKEPS